MRNLIRALARLPGRRLRLLLKAGRIEARVQSIENRLAVVRKEEARLERLLSSAGERLTSLMQGVGAGRRGPGRPPKYRGPGHPPRHRGPGRPPKRRGPGRPPKTPGAPGGRRRVNERPLAQVLKDVLSKKNQAYTVSELATMARENGYNTKSKPAVFAITVSLALRKNPQLFQRTGRKYELSKSAEAKGS